jgi:predicted molibdopterin-dependent oxidoreductase YjgC
MGELLAPRDAGITLVSGETDGEAPEGLTLFTYPLLVDEGRLSERADELKSALAATPFVEIHPDDAASGSIEDGADVVVTTSAGEATLPVRVTEHVARGAVFVPFNQAGFHANRLLDGDFMTSVTVEPAAALVDAERGSAG